MPTMRVSRGRGYIVLDPECKVEDEIKLERQEWEVLRAWWMSAGPFLDTPKRYRDVFRDEQAGAYYEWFRSLAGRGVLVGNDDDGYVIAPTARPTLDWWAHRTNGRPKRTRWHQRGGSDFKGACRRALDPDRFARLCELEPENTPVWGCYWERWYDEAKQHKRVPIPRQCIAGDVNYHDPATFNGRRAA